MFSAENAEKKWSRLIKQEIHITKLLLKKQYICIVTGAVEHRSKNMGIENEV